ncbi:MAG: FecR domain-containing protein [Candidatus Omnitrophica bacterium]|nr:FecR domain-containing protein [Candidatus Omnitrophota bacterium]
MKLKQLAVLVIVNFLLSNIAVASSIPPMPEVDDATAAAKPELAGRRDALVKERNDLRKKSMKQKAACSDVEEDTPAERDCAAWLARITAEVDLHVQATNDLAGAISAVSGYKAFALPAIRVEGEVFFLTADGRKLTGAEAAGVAIDNRTTIFTGKDSRAFMILPDGTSFTVGANSEMMLDDFVYDPSTDMQKMTLKLAKGGFRWVSGKVKRIEPLIQLSIINVGIRGTDFECSVDAQGLGFVKLYAGELELTDKTTGQINVLTEGKKVHFSAEGMSAPQILLVSETPPHI